MNKGPVLTVDVIIEYGEGIVLIERKNPPFGWALPGGHVDYGETVEAAAIREAREETSLEVTLERQFHVYSDPARSPDKHAVSVVFIAVGSGELKAGDDAKAARVFRRSDIPELCFDHNQILEDYFGQKY
jgi:8-oxo-dGTP diphosphatase